jgi:hypothetical protein
MNQLGLFDAYDVITTPDEPGRYQYAGVLYTAVGGARAGRTVTYPLPSTLQRCDCDCRECGFLGHGHCSLHPCGFSDVMPNSALTLVGYIRDQQRTHNIEPDARLAWRRISTGPWQDR